MIKQIVIVEDNAELVEFLSEIIQSKLGIAVQAFATGARAMKYLSTTKPSLVIIDLQLEDIRGEAICQQLREKYADLPIVILTGNNSIDSIVSCLNAGADDYIIKPFDVSELVARLNARLRQNKQVPSQNILSVQNIKMNQETLEVTKDEQTIELTAKEFELLRYLLIHKGITLTRDKILAAVWGYHNLVDTRVVDVHIGKLRRKLNPHDENGTIKTMRGFGYRISED